MLPKSSMDDKRLVTTLCLASRNAPRASEKVITMGNASGIMLMPSAIEKYKKIYNSQSAAQEKMHNKN